MKKTIILFIAIVLTGQLHAHAINKKPANGTTNRYKNVWCLVKPRFSKHKIILRTGHLLFENGQIWNVDTLIIKAVLLNTATDFKRINSFDFLNTKVNKHTAWVSYNLLSAITRNGKQGFVQWMETVVLVKEKKDGKSKCCIQHLLNVVN